MTPTDKPESKEGPEELIKMFFPEVDGKRRTELLAKLLGNLVSQVAMAVKMAEALRHVVGSGVSFEDSRLEYKEIQIDRDFLEDCKKLVAEFDALTNKEGKK
jgi:hypothetical protein